VCDKLGLKFGRCTNDVKAVLKEKGINDPSSAQLKKAIDKIEGEHHAIFSYTRQTNQIMRC